MTLPARSPVAGAPALLVSVRSAAEAAEGFHGGAAVIDIKEPAAGPLGAAPPETVAAILAEVAGRAPVTAALGELAGAASEGLPGGLAAVKCGLAGAAQTDWPAELTRLRDRLPGETRLVPVAYADHAAASAPPPERVLAVAESLASGWLVLDTWDKQGPGVLETLPADRLRALVAEAASHGVSVALAGRLTAERLAEAAACGPAIVGVRGAACVGGRGGAVSRRRVRSLIRSLGAARTPAPSPA